MSMRMRMPDPEAHWVEVETTIIAMTPYLISQRIGKKMCLRRGQYFLVSPGWWHGARRFLSRRRWKRPRSCSLELRLFFFCLYVNQTDKLTRLISRTPNLMRRQPMIKLMWVWSGNPIQACAPRVVPKTFSFDLPLQEEVERKRASPKYFGTSWFWMCLGYRVLSGHRVECLSINRHVCRCWCQICILAMQVRN